MVPNERGAYSVSGQCAAHDADWMIIMHWSGREGGSLLGGARNWLPAGERPRDGVDLGAQLILRLYKPREALRRATASDAGELCRSYKFPAVKRIIPSWMAPSMFELTHSQECSLEKAAYFSV
jgi:hypothetical protein